MGKAKGKNGFFYFMIHKQSEMKRNGQNLPMNSPRLQQIAGDEWKVMSEVDRQPYNSRAKSEKDRSKSQPIHLQPQSYQRQESLGRQLATAPDEDEDRELYLDKMIECCVKACKTTEELINASFFVISSNIMCRTDDKNEYYPLEIGICQYTIKEGIQFTYHQFIDAGRVPLGYMNQAKSWMEDTHKIPLDNFIAASNNYRKIVEDIVQILDNSRFTNELSGKPTPMLVYCKEDQVEQNKGVLEWLAKKYRSFMPSFDWDLEVLDLVNLVFHISNSNGTPITPAIAEDYLSSSAYDYSMDTNCAFHEEQDNKNCARGAARRCCYMLSTALCPLFEVAPTNNHLPPKRDNVVADTYRVELHDVTLPPANRYHSSLDPAMDDWAPSGSGTQTDESQNRPNKLLGIGRGRGWKR